MPSTAFLRAHSVHSSTLDCEKNASGTVISPRSTYAFTFIYAHDPAVKHLLRYNIYAKISDNRDATPNRKNFQTIHTPIAQQATKSRECVKCWCNFQIEIYIYKYMYICRNLDRLIELVLYSCGKKKNGFHLSYYCIASHIRHSKNEKHEWQINRIWLHYKTVICRIKHIICNTEKHHHIMYKVQCHQTLNTTGSGFESWNSSIHLGSKPDI